jgi:DNA-binding NarL/FixJ family response regulator
LPSLRRILVVDDDHALCAFVSDTARHGGYDTAVAASGEKALELLTPPPDLILLDVHLPGISGYEVLHQLRSRGVESPVVFISGERTESFDRVAGMLLGGVDYLVKPFAPDELLARIRSALARMSSRQHSPGLTSREVEVLTLLTHGRAQSEIATELGISSRTVGTHIEHILTKLNVHSRAQAVALALRHQLVS